MADSKDKGEKKEKKRKSKKSKEGPTDPSELAVEEVAPPAAEEASPEAEPEVAQTEQLAVEKPQEPKEKGHSSALDLIEEIFNPSVRIPESSGPYKVPEAVKAGDVNALRDLDERKIIELKEAFLLFDTDSDGYISAEDLIATFRALGKEPTYEEIESMLEEAMSPLDFDAFIVLMGYKTIELDPEDVLLEAWSKWDKDGSGVIEESKIYHDLISYGDRFSKKEARDALDTAPLAKAKALDEAPMIDYQAFCRTMAGLRKRKQES